MKKMGWQPGEGLGKFKQGPATPFEISLKTDRKGLWLQFDLLIIDTYQNSKKRHLLTYLILELLL